MLFELSKQWQPEGRQKKYYSAHNFATSVTFGTYMSVHRAIAMRFEVVRLQ